MKKKILIILGVIGLAISIQLPVHAESAVNDTIVRKTHTSIEVQAANIGYRYKSIDGKIYRCLYDYTNQKWIGEWELCP